jgi:hypothetical protein
VPLDVLPAMPVLPALDDEVPPVLLLVPAKLVEPPKLVVPPKPVEPPAPTVTHVELHELSTQPRISLVAFAHVELLPFVSQLPEQNAEYCELQELITHELHAGELFDMLAGPVQLELPLSLEPHAGISAPINNATATTNPDLVMLPSLRSIGRHTQTPSPSLPSIPTQECRISVRQRCQLLAPSPW